MTDPNQLPAISFDMRVEIPETVLLQELEGEFVALNLESELYLGLNASATRMLKALSESKTVGEAHERLLLEYEVEAEELRTALLAFVGNLLEHGLVELSDP